MTSRIIDTGRVVPRALPILLSVLIGAGLAGFMLLMAFREDARAWQVYLVNFLFFSAVAQGGLLFSMIMHMTRARWSGPLQSLSEAFAAFFPVSFLLFLVLFMGKAHVFPWLGQNLHGKEIWLNLPFLFTRDTVGLLVLYVLGFVYAWHALKLKCRPLKTSGGLRGLLNRIICAGGIDADRCKKRMTVLSVLYMIAYAGVLSLISVDLVMSANPHWVSTLFGGYFFIKAVFIGMGGLIITAALIHIGFPEDALVTPAQFHDIGKLFFAFCILWTYFLYTQVLVIWYGNIPEETHYLIERLHYFSWKLVFVTAFVLAFVLPFFTLINQKAKTRPVIMLVICSLALTGIWLENLLLIGPSVHYDTESLSLRMFDVMISLGFLGLMALAVTTVLSLFPELMLKYEKKG